MYVDGIDLFGCNQTNQASLSPLTTIILAVIIFFIIMSALCITTFSFFLFISPD